MDAVPPGRYLAISHMGSDLLSPETNEGRHSVSGHMSQQQRSYRTREQVARFFEGTDLVPPGLVLAEEWHSEPPTDQAGNSALWAAVGQKR
jgi:S-adenosyl methyltransferase